MTTVSLGTERAIVSPLCKSEAKALEGLDDPNMCIRGRYQECIFKASAMRVEFCEPRKSEEKINTAHPSVKQTK
jgi:hypothetical protein